MPLTVVAPTQIGELTTGAAVLLCTVTDEEAALWHLSVEVAFAVITLPAAKFGRCPTRTERTGRCSKPMAQESWAGRRTQRSI